MSGIDLPEEAKRLLLEGSKVAAIAAVHRQLGVGLTEAMRLVEQYLLRQPATSDLASAAQEVRIVARVSLRDALQFPSGAMAPSQYRCEIFCRVPQSWVQEGRLTSVALEGLCAFLYGDNWRNGNEDGSAYRVLECESRVLTEAEVTMGPWLAVEEMREVKYWFCHAGVPYRFYRVSREAL